MRHEKQTKPSQAKLKHDTLQRHNKASIQYLADESPVSRRRNDGWRRITPELMRDKLSDGSRDGVECSSLLASTSELCAVSWKLLSFRLSSGGVFFLADADVCTLELERPVVFGDNGGDFNGIVTSFADELLSVDLAVLVRLTEDVGGDVRFWLKSDDVDAPPPVAVRGYSFGLPGVLVAFLCAKDVLLDMDRVDVKCVFFPVWEFGADTVDVRVLFRETSRAHKCENVLVEKFAVEKAG